MTSIYINLVKFCGELINNNNNNNNNNNDNNYNSVLFICSIPSLIALYK